LAFITVELNKK